MSIPRLEHLFPELIELIKNRCRLRLVRSLLRRDLPPEPRREMNTLLDQIRFQGYRPGKRPERQDLERRLIDNLPHMRSILPRLLHVWKSAHPDITKQVDAALSSPERKASELAAWDAETTIKQAEIIADECGLLLEDVIIAWASLLSPVQSLAAPHESTPGSAEEVFKGDSDIADATPSAPGSAYAPGSSTDSIPGLEPVSRVEVEITAMSTDRWTALLAELERIPAESAEWDRIGAFLESATALSRKRAEERIPRRRIVELLSALPAFTEELIYFETLVVDHWSAEQLNPAHVVATCEQIEKLIDLLGRFREIRGRRGSTRQEERIRRDTEQMLEDELGATLSALSAAFTPINPSGSPRSEEVHLEVPSSDQHGNAEKLSELTVFEPAPPPVEFQERDAGTKEPSAAEKTWTSGLTTAGVRKTLDSELVATLPSETPVSAPPPEVAISPQDDPGVYGMDRAVQPPPPAASGNIPPTQNARRADGDSKQTHALTGCAPSAIFATEPEAASAVPAVERQAARVEPKPAPVISEPIRLIFGEETRVEPLPSSRRNDTSFEKPPSEVAGLVKWILEHDDKEAQAQAFCRLVWELMRQSRLGIAYHIARCVESLGRNSPEVVPSTAIKGLALCPLVSSSFGEVVDDLRNSIRELQDHAVGMSDLDPASRVPRTLLLFALSLRPALLAPSTGAAALLEQIELHGPLSGLNALRSAILWFGHLNIELTPSILKGVLEHAAWESQLHQHRRKVQEWREHSRHAQIVYAPATHVWRRWFEPGGPLTPLFDIITEDRRGSIKELRHAITQWSSPQNIDQEANKADREIRPDAKKKPIEARARSRLQLRVKEAMSLLQAWIDLLENEPLQNADSRYVRANEHRVEVLTYLGEAEQTVRSLLDSSGGSRAPLAVAGALTLDTITNLRNLFDPASPAREEIHPRDALSRELLAIPSISLDSEWKPPQSAYASPDLLDALLAHLERGPVDWQRAFREQCAYGNHKATDGILDLLTRHAEPEMDLIQLRREQEKAIAECRAKLKLSLKHTKAAVERAIVEDLFPESRLLVFSSTVDEVDADGIRDFARVERSLENVLQQIEVRRQERIAEVWARLKSTPHPKDLAPIERALEKGDVLAANEYIAMLERDEPIHSLEPERNIFAEFFPNAASTIQQALDRGARSLDRTIGQNEGQGPLDTSNLTVEQADEARKMLRAWRDVGGYQGSDAGGRTQSLLIDVLRCLGFRNVQFTPADGQISERIRSYNMQVDTIREQQTCVIPQYGSLARGRYRVLCVWKRPSEEEIVELAGSTQHHDQPIIVFYFGRMSEARRRSLAVLCRQRRRTLLLIDEVLLYFLAMEKGLRLPALFSCTFPFTVVDPYTTTAGLVPTEMFFGRGRERRLVFEPTGTNLVYGGRQLGKTALLRDVERRHHAPTNGIIVKWIDLKAEGIGLNRPIQDVWVIIANALHREGVLPRTDYGAELFMTRIAEWLDKHPNRRIVLLLDETDAFLKSDSEVKELHGEAFPNVGRLKGIMDKTSRRFKVVFAGLHNVQRTSRDVNSPLAHLGAPICIGPLLENGEWQEARRLVTAPFTQLGYQFESDDLPMRILAHANWYPSLIQLFCKHLLEHLTHPNRAAFSVHSCPPYTITAQHIEEAYQSQELRKAIVDRFRWTLDLDPRYRIIALCILFESATRREGFITGFSVQRLRELALYWWESGFKGTTTIEGFRTILDEMIGLGLLRRVGGANYALRSPNVVNLLGTTDEIEQALLDATQHQPPPEYEAATFRRAIRQSTKRSPLTAQQESELLAPAHGVSVIFGSKAAGLADTILSLTEASSAQNVAIDDNWGELKSVIMFREMLIDRTERRDEGLAVFVVPVSCPWTIEWVLGAAEKLGNFKSSKKLVRVIFLADPPKTWLWVQRDAMQRDKLEDATVREVTLRGCPKITTSSSYTM